MRFSDEDIALLKQIRDRFEAMTALTQEILASNDEKANNLSKMASCLDCAIQICKPTKNMESIVDFEAENEQVSDQETTMKKRLVSAPTRYGRERTLSTKLRHRRFLKHAQGDKFDEIQAKRSYHKVRRRRMKRDHRFSSLRLAYRICLPRNKLYLGVDTVQSMAVSLAEENQQTHTRRARFKQRFHEFKKRRWREKLATIKYRRRIAKKVGKISSPIFCFPPESVVVGVINHTEAQSNIGQQSVSLNKRDNAIQRTTEKRTTAISMMDGGFIEEEQLSDCSLLNREWKPGDIVIEQAQRVRLIATYGCKRRVEEAKCLAFGVGIDVTQPFDPGRDYGGFTSVKNQRDKLRDIDIKAVTKPVKNDGNKIVGSLNSNYRRFLLLEWDTNLERTCFGGDVHAYYVLYISPGEYKDQIWLDICRCIELREFHGNYEAVDESYYEAIRVGSDWGTNFVWNPGDLIDVQQNRMVRYQGCGIWLKFSKLWLADELVSSLGNGEVFDTLCLASGEDTGSELPRMLGLVADAMVMNENWVIMSSLSNRVWKPGRLRIRQPRRVGLESVKGSDEGIPKKSNAWFRVQVWSRCERHTYPELEIYFEEYSKLWIWPIVTLVNKDRCKAHGKTIRDVHHLVETTQNLFLIGWASKNQNVGSKHFTTYACMIKMTYGVKNEENGFSKETTKGLLLQCAFDVNIDRMNLQEGLKEAEKNQKLLLEMNSCENARVVITVAWQENKETFVVFDPGIEVSVWRHKYIGIKEVQCIELSRCCVRFGVSMREIVAATTQATGNERSNITTITFNKEDLEYVDGFGREVELCLTCNLVKREAQMLLLGKNYNYNSDVEQLLWSHKACLLLNEEMVVKIQEVILDSILRSMVILCVSNRSMGMGSKQKLLTRHKGLQTKELSWFRKLYGMNCFMLNLLLSEFLGCNALGGGLTEVVNKMQTEEIQSTDQIHGNERFRREIQASATNVRCMFQVCFDLSRENQFESGSMAFVGLEELCFAKKVEQILFKEKKMHKLPSIRKLERCLENTETLLVTFEQGKALFFLFKMLYKRAGKVTDTATIAVNYEHENVEIVRALVRIGDKEGNFEYSCLVTDYGGGRVNTWCKQVSYDDGIDQIITTTMIQHLIYLVIYNLAYSVITQVGVTMFKLNHIPGGQGEDVEQEVESSNNIFCVKFIFHSGINCTRSLIFAVFHFRRPPEGLWRKVSILGLRFMFDTDRWIAIFLFFHLEDKVAFYGGSIVMINDWACIGLVGLEKRTEAQPLSISVFTIYAIVSLQYLGLILAL